ncbi:Uncharacterised protein [Vibrio cholerae]|nr:Uncharacterised protein [Vibrio cholerae]
MIIDINFLENFYNPKIDQLDNELILYIRNFYSLYNFLGQFFDNSLKSDVSDRLIINQVIIDDIWKELVNGTFYDLDKNHIKDFIKTLFYIEERLEKSKTIYFYAKRVRV